MLNTKLMKCAFVGAATTLALVPAIASAEAFDGPYVGVEAGLGIVKSKGSLLTGPFKRTDNSAVVNAVAGYRLPLGEDSPVVVGVEGNAGVYTNGGDARYGVAGMGGFKLADTAMVYGKVGYAWLDGVPNGTGKGLDGLVFGGGAEVALTDSISARAEYRHIDYGGVNFPDNVVDWTGHEVTAALLFNF